MRACFLPLLGLVFLGCGSDPTGIVKGKVTYAGKPVVSGRILFDTPAGLGTATTDEEGYYTALHVPVGEARIAVMPPAPVPGTKSPRSKVPLKYEKTETSGLTFTVTRGELEFDIDLK